MNFCKNCNKETKNPKYCSRSCAATTNNKLTKPKPNSVNHCLDCGKVIQKVSLRCRLCNKALRRSGITLGDLTYDHLHKASTYALVRFRARTDYSGDKKCAVCGYSKHYEVCHIKPISSYSNDALLSEINSPSNLIALCPNCHWELDHGLTRLVEQLS